uniref:CSON011970 protein n=1 Tax=Culicoides sonorensis TaxID=179676 RepID=A0A336KP55_CULSO
MFQEKLKCPKYLKVLCYMCGKFTPKNKQRTITSVVEEHYFECYGIKIMLNEFTPHFICLACQTKLFKKNEMQSQKNWFKTPFIWKKPRDDHKDCYVCLMPNLQGKSWSMRHKIEYPTNSCCILPILNGSSSLYHVNSTVGANFALDIIRNGSFGDWTPSKSINLTTSFLEIDSFTSQDNNVSEYFQYGHRRELNPRPLHQASFNDLVRDLLLDKNRAELLGSRLAQFDLIQPSTKITASRSRSDELKKFFSQEEDITYVNNISNLFNFLDFPHNAKEWRLFMDSNKKSFKVILLHIGNLYPSIPVAYTENTKETRILIEKILNLINYYENEWLIVADLKVVAILIGLKGGYPSYPCIFCTYHSRSKVDHYNTKWPLRTKFVIGELSVQSPPLINVKNVILPPLHIKLGVATQFLKKVFGENTNAKDAVRKIFPGKSEAKIVAGIVDGPQLKKLLQNSEFLHSLSKNEKDAWLGFNQLCSNVFGNFKSPKFLTLVKDMVLKFKKCDVKVSPKLHLLINHIDRFPANLGDFSDEQGERAHQDFKNVEMRFTKKGKTSNISAMADFLWLRMREKKTQYKKSKGGKTIFFQKNK